MIMHELTGVFNKSLNIIPINWLWESSGNCQMLSLSSSPYLIIDNMITSNNKQQGFLYLQDVILKTSQDHPSQPVSSTTGPGLHREAHELADKSQRNQADTFK